MFDIGWSEFVVIGVVALIVIGPKELPAVLRTVGQWTTKIRRMAAEFQSQFQEAMREAEMADLKKEVDKLGDAAKGFSSDFDPLKEATKWEPKADKKAEGEGAANDVQATPAAEAAIESGPPAVASAPVTPEPAAPPAAAQSDAAPAAAPVDSATPVADGSRPA